MNTENLKVANTFNLCKWIVTDKQWMYNYQSDCGYIGSFASEFDIPTKCPYCGKKPKITQFIQHKKRGNVAYA